MNRILPIVLALAIVGVSSSCTLVGAGLGGAIGSSRQPSSAEMQPVRDSSGRMTYPDRPMSTVGHVAIGGLVGAGLDIALLLGAFGAFVDIFGDCGEGAGGHC